MPNSDQKTLAKRNADTMLMPPPPVKRQKRPQTVLDEDVYHDAVSHIVARDFFPGLLETQAQQEYLTALDSKDKDWLRHSGRRLTQVMTPLPDTRRRHGTGTSFKPKEIGVIGDTPRTYYGETPTRATESVPGSIVDGDLVHKDQPDVDLNLSLGSFQARYTSEDNESFNALLDKQNEKRTAKYAFFHNGNQITSARQIAHRAREQKQLQSGGASTALIVRNAAGDERRAFSSTNPSQDLDARPASVDSFPNREGSRNNLMFSPDGVDTTSSSNAWQPGAKLDVAAKSITHSATRFAITSDASDTTPPSPSISAIDAAIAGRPRPTDSELGYTGAETPRVNGYAFVDAEPTPSEMGMPVTDEEADAAEAAAAMKLLPKLETGGPNPFSIRKRSKREDLHHRLVEKADASRRKEKGGSRLDRLRHLGITPGGKTPTPRFSTAPTINKTDQKKAVMTPAARRLMASIQTPRPRNTASHDDTKEKSDGGW